MLARLCWVAVLLVAGIGPAFPQLKKGTPEEILGPFGESIQECRSYHRHLSEVLNFTEREFTWCGTNHCAARILGHRPTPSGFILRLAGNPPWQITFKRGGKGVYELIYQGIKRTEVIHRCGLSDSIAGIGLPTPLGPDDPDTNFPELSDLIRSPDGIFSASYARAVPLVCPVLKANAELIEGIIQLGRLGYLNGLLREGSELVPKGGAPEEAADEHLEWLNEKAVDAVRDDAELIENFCKLVLDAFGPQGRVIANLIKE